MTHPTPTSKRSDLAGYLDGELAPEDAAAFEAALAADPSVAAELEAHRRLGRLLAAAPEGLEPASMPSELDFARVRKGIWAAIDGADASADAAREAAAPRPVGTVRTLDRAARARRSVYGVVVSLTAAAAVALVAMRPSVSGPVQSSRRSNGTEIVNVEFGKISGTYWEQSEGEDKVAIVWIDDTVLEEVGRP